jgi:hypothetical protein
LVGLRGVVNGGDHLERVVGVLQRRRKFGPVGQRAMEATNWPA